MPIFKQLFGNIDFESIAQNPYFKEDSVREVIILPILKELGYTQENIVRSKTLHDPFLKKGTKKLPVNLVPDYILKIENNYTSENQTVLSISEQTCENGRQLKKTGQMQLFA